jgi:hypothetical protein
MSPIRKNINKTDNFLFDNLMGSVDDVFYNSFDRTWAKVPEGQEDPSRFWTKLPIEVADDDGTVEYQYNNDFFRCDDFSTKHNNPHILFAGCSQTEGVGAPLETIWPKVLLNNINKDKGFDSKFYNIAKSGYGWQKIIATYMVYIEKYGIPEYLFVLLPNLGRFFEWDDETDSYRYVQRYPNGGGVSTDQLDEEKVPDFLLIERPLSKQEHRKCFIDFSISWKLFEKYCESIGTKLLWGSWDYEENKNYKLANLTKNYIDLTDDEFVEFVTKQRPDGRLGEFDLSRRDGHAGILINEYWASKFYEEIKNRGWLQ